jgi:LysR family glycine cleavage system transcriptional activator
MKNLSHLNALRALDAVLRDGTLTAAANSLGVTPAAVSQRIRALEDYLNCALLRHEGRKVVPTEITRSIQHDLGDGFDALMRCWTVLHNQSAQSGGALTITAPPSVASAWLMPRLDEMRAITPDADLEIEATAQLVDLERRQFDFAIRYTRASRGKGWLRLAGEMLIPVCAPHFVQDAEGGGLFEGENVPIIWDNTLAHIPNFPSWADWFREQGISRAARKSDFTVNSSTLAVEAAIRGQGVLLARSMLIRQALADGTLVTASPYRLRSPLSYWLIERKSVPRRRGARRLRQWLVAEFASNPAGRRVRAGAD